MYTVKRVIFAVVALVSLNFSLLGCSSDLDSYRDQIPEFDLFGYFQGTTYAWGMVQDFQGNQTRRFEVVIEGQVNNGQLVLVEDFVFADGEMSQRIWTISRVGPGEYRGQADDVIGVAVGREVGNALNWRYDMFLEREGGSTVEVHFNDWMYRQDENHVFNLADIKKFGITVGTVTLFFQKPQ
ncbi:DUF3833 domain-containing protein [Vibrio sp. SM6]|uniref:DUF3833 domain-containing protein n=1 Tax=Vibrio agarilyticus TaxID=2726741 RepID=A0A7X8YF44_9VIBR|nr:DUF3833 domain-containing protein [Vibrio agarilyticus]NLS11453.1 DUF3833 domain-containing protein [Vibrio agarilyticus]